LEAAIVRLEDVAMVRDPIEQRGCNLGIAEHAGPFADARLLIVTTLVHL